MKLTFTVARPMRMKRVGMIALVVLLGCTAAPEATRSPEPPTPARGESARGGFRLVFELASATWHAGETISGTASLERTGEETVISGSGGGPIAFEYRELDGKHHVEPAWTADCAPHRLASGMQISEPIGKSGGYSDNDPDAQFMREFLQSPGVRLPSGIWDITAIAWFHDGAECRGLPHRIRSTVRVTVTP